MELRSDRLRVFDAVVRHGGFSAAARALGVTQSSVSQSIAALEADAGEPLFERAGRQVRLTAAGEVLRAHAGAVLRALDEAKGALEAQRDVARGTLALGTSDTLATYLLPPVFRAFRERYPGVELRLDNRPSPAIAEAVAAHVLDVGVVSLPLPTTVSGAVRALKQVPLVPQRDVVVAPKGHGLARRARVRPAELERFPLVLLDRTTASRAWLEAQFAAAGVHPRVAMEMNSVEVVKRLAALGFGVAVVPELAVRAGDGLSAVPLVGATQRRMVGLLVGAAPSRAARAFIELAREVLRPVRASAGRESGTHA
ncbi:MAG: LysR substrate-binding domain-containing protein [Myxococcota bacterium]